MCARILSSVLLPLPLGPTMPRNSPSATEKVTSRSTSCRSYVIRFSGCAKYSLSRARCSCGIRNDFETPTTSIAFAIRCAPRSEERPDPADGEEDGDRGAVREEGHRRRERARERDHERGEGEPAQRGAARHDRRERRCHRVGDEGVEDDPDQQVERIAVDAELEE